MTRPRVVILAMLAGAAATDGVAAGDEGPGPDPGDRTGPWLAVAAEALRPSGVLRADYFQSSRMLDDETGLVGITAQLKLLPRFSGALDGKLEVRFANPDIASHGDARAEL